MKLQFSESQFRVWVTVAVCLVGWAAYWNTFSGDFVWDDASSVLLNEHIQDPSFLGQLFREDQHAFGRGQGNFYRPLVNVSFMADYAVAKRPGADPAVFPFHVTNTLWHVAAALLLLGLLTAAGAPRFVRAAVPLIYVAHPLHTEAIAYISGRADPMSAAFLFAGLLCAIRGRAALGAVAASCCFALGLLCKESAFIFPALLALFAIIVPRQTTADGKRPAYRRPWAALASACAVLALYGALRFTVLRFGSDTTPRAISFLDRMTEVGQAFALYLRLLLVPTGLHMERTLADVPGWVAALGGLALAGCLALIGVALKCRQHRLALGISWFLVTWFPISGVFPLNAPMAEHWMYVPMAGFFWALAELTWLAMGRGKGRRVAVAAAYALLVWFVALTVARNRDWQDGESLFRATLAQNPRSIRVQYNLAVTYEDILGNDGGAQRHYEEVLRLRQAGKQASSDPNQAAVFYDDELESHLSLGRILLRQSKYDAAVAHFTTLLSLEPSEHTRYLRAEAAVGLGDCFLGTGRPEQAAQWYRQGVSLVPALRERVPAGMLEQAEGKRP